MTSSSASGDTRDLLNKISLKNQAIQSLEAKIVSLETAQKTFNERLSAAQNELQGTRAECQRLKLKVNSRGAPYFQVIQEFFSKDIEKFVPEGHKCTCNVCGKDITQVVPPSQPEVPVPQVEANPVQQQELQDVQMVDPSSNDVIIELKAQIAQLTEDLSI